MKFTCKTIILFWLLILSQCLFAQSEFTMGRSSHIKTSSCIFYDDGGKYGNISNKVQTATFEAAGGSIEIYFADFDIPYGAEMRVYNGYTVSDELVAVFHKGDKIYNVKYPVITIQYIPAENTTNARGWKGIIIPNTFEKNLKLLATKPESDCPNAIAICSNTTINTSANQYDDTGLINDDAGSCYSGTGSGGSVWYTFSPQSNGPLDFKITPLGTTDYDFVLWDITNGCGNKTELSCNFSGTSGATGLSSLGSTNSEPASGPVWCQKVNVVTTKKYAICINYYGGTNGGFSLTFKNEAGSVDIWDVTPPTILNAFSFNCVSTTSLTLNFSELCQCSTIQNTDFTIPGYSFTVTNMYCTSNGTLKVDLAVSPALAAGTYTLNGANILDMCGNNMNSNIVITLGTPPNPTISAASVVCKNPGFLGIGFVYSPSSQVLTAGGGSSYIWPGNILTASLSVSPVVTTVYTATVIQGACAATVTRQVIVEQVIANAGPDQTICAGFPTTLTATGGGTYQWASSTTSASGPWTTISGATSNTLAVSPGVPTWYRVTVTGPNGCTNTDVIKVNTGAGSFGITSSKPFACQGENITLTLPGGITSYTWSTGTSANTPLVVAPLTTTNYTATSTTAGCAGSATISVPVRLNPPAVASATPATACPGFPVSLNANPTPTTITFTENFEGATNGFTIINGANNKWYHGTFNKCNGTKSLYIGTAATDNNYVNYSGFSGKAAVNFAYRDFTISGYCSADLTFNWKCLGKATDFLSVWIIPTSVTPVAGTALVTSSTQSMVGGPYWNAGTACNSASINLSSYVGQSIRVVFSWENTAGNIISGNTAAPPAALIDDVVLTQVDSYGYSWSSSPAGLSSTSASVITTPTVATSYSVILTRCDGCVSTAVTSVGTCAVLPVELISYKGECKNNQATLNWSTASEKNNNYFIISKSRDASGWKEVARINSAGNSSNIKNYSYTDVSPYSGLSYYLLTQVDKDKTQKQLGIISSDCEAFNPGISYYPNPFTNSLTLDVKNISGHKATVTVYNVLGQKLKEIVLSSEGVLNGQFDLNISELSQGTYFINFESDDFNKTEKIIKSE